jgi:hypothetical protein
MDDMMVTVGASLSVHSPKYSYAGFGGGGGMEERHCELRGVRRLCGGATWIDPNRAQTHILNG